ncbi:hypothetical protein J4462_04860 [Candidatus Pacearchaeota archaeon]|nr:hypothetical protein [Candidatus Pacearchaeota archaeon]
MAVDEIVSLSPEDITELVATLGNIGNWLQTIGVIVVIWLLFQIVNWYFNHKRIQKLNTLQENMERLEKKIDRLSRKK